MIDKTVLGFIESSEIFRTWDLRTFVKRSPECLGFDVWLFDGPKLLFKIGIDSFNA